MIQFAANTPASVVLVRNSRERNKMRLLVLPILTALVLVAPSRADCPADQASYKKETLPSEIKTINCHFFWGNSPPATTPWGSASARGSALSARTAAARSPARRRRGEASTGAGWTAQVMKPGGFFLKKIEVKEVVVGRQGRGAWNN